MKNNNNKILNLIKGFDSERKIIQIKQATKKGYIECSVPGVADFSFPTSKLRRGRVQRGGGICPTLMAANPMICVIEDVRRDIDSEQNNTSGKYTNQ